MFELFHAITDPGSAKVRKYVVDHELEASIRFRNVTYEEVQRDLTSRGGTGAPALWDGERLITGAEAIVARLIAHADVGRES
jgi:hypothetical protein